MFFKETGDLQKNVEEIAHLQRTVQNAFNIHQKYVKNGAIIDKKLPKVIQNEPWSALGSHLGRKGTQGSQTSRPRATILEENGPKMEPKWSQKCFQNRLKIKRAFRYDSGVILDAKSS